MGYRGLGFVRVLRRFYKDIRDFKSVRLEGGSYGVSGESLGLVGFTVLKL